jgi:hypothetical protein
MEHEFSILGLHDHMTEKQRYLLFVHCWKVAAAADVGDALKAAPALVKTR